jgi:GntR family transcriptional regulator
MNGVQSFSQELLGLNMRPSAKLLSCKIRKADSTLRSTLELQEGEEVVTISRLRLVNNEPCMVEVMNFPYKLIPGVEKEDLSQSIYCLLKGKYQQEVVSARDILEPIIIGEYESQLLQLKMPSAGMRTNRVGYDANNRPIEYSIHIIPGKKCTLVFERTK